MKYIEQIQRIKRKLLEAKNADKNLKVFGADSHKYNLNPPATEAEVLELEKRYSIQLPECYRTFITQVGNGGNAYSNSAAGPFYGIYPLGCNLNELVDVNAQNYLIDDCIIHPKMSVELWKSLTKHLEDNDEDSEEINERESGKIYAGVLPIGSQGCTYLHGIVLNGPYRGRIVNLDSDHQKPRFAFEGNFLDWYERWLDEVISGELIKDGTTWFGYTKGGTEEELLNCNLTSTDSDEKNDCLNGLLSKDVLTADTLTQIESLIKVNAASEYKLIQLLCKSNYEKAKPYLLERAKTDLLSVFQLVYWYAKTRSNEWLNVIEDNLHRIDDNETLRFCTYLLKEAGIDYSRFLIPFTKNKHEELRVHAFYSLGLLENKKDYIEVFINGLKDNSTEVIRVTLQALSGMKDNRLLEHYRNIATRFPVEQDYIHANLNQVLAEYGLTNETIIDQKN